MDNLSIPKLRSAIIMITHGSRRHTFVEDMQKLATYLEEKLEVPVFLSHNEYTEPNWRNILLDLSDKGFDHFVFALAFLGRGNHVARDIMGEVGASEFYQWTKTKYKDRDINVYFTRPLADSELVKLALFYRVKGAFQTGEEPDYIEDPEEIEERTMNMIREKVKEELKVEGEELEVVSRAVFASGNLELAKHVVISPGAITSGVEALRAEMPILTDVKMVMAGIRWKKVENYLDSSAELAKKLKITRTAANIRMGLTSPKIVVIGNAPTALVEVLRVQRENSLEVPLVVATPPGFTNAVESKEELIKSGLPSIVVRGTYGGSSIAVAIINELIRVSMK
ncbi:bifunctional sirohydrochlorin cobalt chelatase/precorrin-8X methylmutase [Stygiolobus caldivivus]|uniref:Bifunctional sirohydrochlorin cobalt chelatase/precorrin-8X methylmutase n=1 Tax=Stygiolobus caldivivus TaxID=2824673 RepID=A0A8D5ZK59_9CREN|nr:bifunctional sirohydrochlorin cobalt chelatase/precorrin-8X methylmutase [Stygiolobus caldivivus]